MHNQHWFRRYSYDCISTNFQQIEDASGTGYPEAADRSAMINFTTK